MRNAFADEITRCAADDDRIVLLSGDIGNRLFNPYKERFAERFFNCGVAEANMTGMAAGMAMCGLRPVTYTIATFNTARCFEQIKLDICYHGLPVIVTGVGAGLSYAELGGTHQALEDIALLRTLPNMTVVCPGDALEVRCALRAALRHDGPVYLRLGKKNEPVVHEREPSLVLGKALVVRPGRDIAVLGTGTMLPAAVETGRNLADRGVSAEVASFHTVKPLDGEYLAAAASRFDMLVTVEEHSVIGGFGSAVAEWCAANGVPLARLLVIGVGDTFAHRCGGQEFAREDLGLTPEAMTARILSRLKETTD